MYIYQYQQFLWHTRIPIQYQSQKKRGIYQLDTSILIYLYTNLLTSKLQPLGYIFK